MFTKVKKCDKNIVLGARGNQKGEMLLPRLSRQNLTTLYFHVIVQGINKEYIFNQKEMLEKYKSLLKENTRESKTKVLAYCIMSNHAHILMYTEEINEMSKMMQKINTSFARYYNGRKNRVGFVFRDRYFTQPILSRQQLYHCLVYIHNNPVKAGMVMDPKDYRYSSYNEWINKKEIIDEMSAQLVYGEEIKDIGKFKEMHFNNEISDIEDIEETIDYNEIIAKYESREKNNIEELVKEKVLDDIVRELRNKSKLSIRQISNILNVNRPKITKIIEKLEK